MAVAALRSWLTSGRPDTTFDYAHPHVEIRTTPLASRPEERLAIELDARALGLDTQRLADGAEAMSWMQDEVLRCWQFLAPLGRAPPRLRAWVERWYASYDPSFLLGTSRQELLEACGQPFQNGLASLRPLRGTVALTPSGPGECSSRLAFLLADLPERTGKWPVIGRITRGLEVVEAISVQPLGEPGPRARRPAEPVAVQQWKVAEPPAANR